MTAQEVNPFASPETVSTRETVKLGAMPPTVALEERSWPFEATKLAEIEEIPRPWGRPVSAARKWGNGRWLAILISALILAYFSFVLSGVLFSSMEATRPSAEIWALSIAGILTICFAVPYTLNQLREDATGYRSLSKLIHRRRSHVQPAPVSIEPAFVAIVPRPRWVFSCYEMTAYVAMSHIDHNQQLLFLDADQFQFRVPSESILDCSVERLPKWPQTLWFVRLVLQTQTGPQELCFRLGNYGSLWQTDGQSEAEAKKYMNRILLLKETT